MSDRQHMIGRMQIEINADRPGQAAHLQQQLGYRLHTNSFLQQIESLLDGLVRADEYLEIPALSISLDCTGEADFNAQFLEKLAAAIRTQLVQKPEGVVLKGGAAYGAETRLFFLKYGVMAFHHGRETIATLYKELRALPGREQPELERLLKTAAAEAPVVWSRLYYILGAAAMKQFFLRFFSCKEEVFTEVVNEYKKIPATAVAVAAAGSFPGEVKPQGAVSASLSTAVLQDARLWPALFQRMLAGNFSPAYAPAANGTQPLNERSSAWSNTPAPETGAPLVKQLQQGFEIENAGLILLWMECGRLFKTLGYVADRQFVSETTQQQAILLLHYIFNGEINGGEEAWLLNKLLCAWPLHLPVNPALAPEEEARQAADDMLAAYLDAWRKDRKFSPAWFRMAFLQRPGRLSRRADGHWKLEIDGRTEDILINKVSIVKYAWMQQILFVQW